MLRASSMLMHLEPAGRPARSRVVPSAAARPPPVRREKSMPAYFIPQTWYACSSTLPHLGITGSRYEIGRQRIAKTDGAKELVVDGIGDGDSVRVLFGGVDAILMANGNVGTGSGGRRLTGDGVAGTDKSSREQQNGHN